jgi:uncharacterized membrane protein (DUF4010 family)
VTVIAMFARNLLPLAIFAQQTVVFAILPITAMSCLAAAFVWFTKGSSPSPGELKLSSPVSIRKLASFGKRYLGHYGVVIVSLIGGLASSASTTAAAALLAAHGETAPYVAGLATVVRSLPLPAPCPTCQSFTG